MSATTDNILREKAKDLAQHLVGVARKVKLPLSEASKIIRYTLEEFDTECKARMTKEDWVSEFNAYRHERDEEEIKYGYKEESE